MDDRVICSQSRAAVSTMASKTGWSCEGARLMTLRTSLVAVWYSSDSCSSRVRACTSSKRRAFSIAITAWSAKVSTSSICLGVTGLAQTVGARGSRSHFLPQQGYTESRTKSPESLQLLTFELGVGEHIGDMNSAAFESCAPENGTAADRRGVMIELLSPARLIAVRRGHGITGPLAPPYGPEIRSAQPSSQLD